MLNILIATKPDDADSVYVKLAAEALGHRVTLWHTSDMPTLQTHSFRLDDGAIKWSAVGAELNIDESTEFDVVWRRRPAKPKLEGYVHPDDLKNATNENRELYNTFWQVVAPDAFWINPPISYSKSSCKLLQLKIASKLGLKIPETLVTSYPEKIIEFIQKYQPGEVVYKPMYPVMWAGDTEMRLTYTKPILLEDLPKPSVLRLTPGIYQKRIEKAFELRVTCMGHTAIATKICSQDTANGKEDWRSVSATELNMQPYALPDEIANKCFALMLKLGVVFGCFDFIVTPEGEYVFLEINEQGQFLWQEEQNASIKLLDPFVKFLVERNTNFVWKSGQESATIAQYRESVRMYQKNVFGVHLDPGLPV